MSRLFLLASSLLLVTFALCAGSLPIAGAQFTAHSYTATELGTLGGQYSQARGVNNAGQVVGESSFGEDDSLVHAFLYKDGVMTDLGTFGGTSSRASAINDAGQVTGQANLPGDFETHAFLYAGGTMRDLGARRGAANSIGHAINDAGFIVGEIEDEAMICWRGLMLGTNLRGARVAYGVNNLGQVVGMLGNNHAFLFSNGRVKDLGTLDGRKGQSFAYAINDRGQIVGAAVSADGTTTHGFIYENGVMRDMGTLSGGYSVAFGINNQGVVVGESDGRAFVYQDGVMTDLNSVTPQESELLKLEAAFDINDGGQIAGRGVYLNRGPRAVLLTPRETAGR